MVVWQPWWYIVRISGMGGGVLELWFFFLLQKLRSLLVIILMVDQQLTQSNIEASANEWHTTLIGPERDNVFRESELQEGMGYFARRIRKLLFFLPVKESLAASLSDSLSVRLPKRKPALQSQLIPAWYTTASCDTEMGWMAGISHILAQLLDFAKQHSQALVEAERDMGKGRMGGVGWGAGFESGR